MRTRHSDPRHSAAWALALLAAAAVFTASLADTPIWSVRGCSPSGSSVGTTLTNVGTQAASGWVEVQAVVGDTPIWSCAPVSAKPGQTVTVPVAFPGQVKTVLSVSVTGASPAY